MKTMVDHAHDFVLPAIHSQAIGVDATLGHGHDAAFLLKEGCRLVHAFDVIKACQLKDERFLFHKVSHEYVDQYVTQLDVALMNVGYLPKQPHLSQTKTASSLSCLQKLLKLLRVKGRLAVVLYPHNEEEMKTLSEWIENLDAEFDWVRISKRKGPVMYGIVKLAL